MVVSASDLGLAAIYLPDGREVWVSKAAANQAVSSRPLSDLARQMGGPARAVDLGPGIPMAPMHQDEGEPRRWNYPPGYNTYITPRALESISFDTLRSLTTNYDVATLCIEKKKDDLAGLDWHIQPRAVPNQSRAEAKARALELEDQVAEATGFFLTPNQEDSFGPWFRMWAHDWFAYDAATIYLRPARDGSLYGLEVVDGTSIRPIIDEYGRQPMPPEVAFGQVIRGVTWSMWSADQLVYEPYWQRPSSPYGWPPILWVLLAVNRALRRQTIDLSNFTEGTLPRAFYRVPDTWSNTQIGELQTIFDELLAGNDIERARVRFVPGGPNTGLDKFAPEPTTEVEEWLLYITCAAYGIMASEIGFLPKSSGLGGKGFAEEQATVNRRRSLVASAHHVKGLFSSVLARPIDRGGLGMPDLEFAWEGLQEEEDSLVKAQATKIYVDMGAISPDQVLEDLDRDPIGLGPYIMTPAGPVLVSTLLAQGDTASTAPAPDSPSAAPGEDVAGEGEALAAAKAADLGRWERKSLKALKAGRPAAVPFSSEVLVAELLTVDDDLRLAKSAADVRAAFAKARGPQTVTPERLALRHELRDIYVAFFKREAHRAVRAVTGKAE